MAVRMDDPERVGNSIVHLPNKVKLRRLYSSGECGKENLFHRDIENGANGLVAAQLNGSSPPQAPARSCRVARFLPTLLRRLFQGIAGKNSPGTAGREVHWPK